MTIHTRNLLTLMTEVFKSINKLNPMFMWEFFEFKETPYSFTSERSLTLQPAKSKSYLIKGVLLRTSLTWNNLKKQNI